MPWNTVTKRSETAETANSKNTFWLYGHDRLARYGPCPLGLSEPLNIYIRCSEQWGLDYQVPNCKITRRLWQLGQTWDFWSFFFSRRQLYIDCNCIACGSQCSCSWAWQFQEAILKLSSLTSLNCFIVMNFISTVATSFYILSFF